MNCVLITKVNQVFSLNNKTLKYTGKWEQNTQKVIEFCLSGKVGTIENLRSFYKFVNDYLNVQIINSYTFRVGYTRSNMLWRLSNKVLQQSV